jgi:uncharacterized protein (DUF433 family)
VAAHIIDQGRGPEVAGTRVTVYRIMDFVREGSTAEHIATELDLTEAQVRVALDYIAVHHRTVEEEYDKLLQRVQQRNPPYVAAGRATSPDVLKQRIRIRRTPDAAHADSSRQ